MSRKKKQPDDDAQQETPESTPEPDLTPEEIALASEADALAAEAVEPEPEPDAAETPAKQELEPEPEAIPEPEAKAEPEPEPKTMAELQNQLQAVEALNARLRRKQGRDRQRQDRLEQIFASTQAEQQQAAQPPLTIAPQDLVLDDQGNYVVPQAVQEQILRQQQAGQQPVVDEATARAQYARGLQLQEYERIKQQTIDRADDPDAIEDIFDQYTEAANWLVTETASIPVDRPITSVRDLKRLLQDEGLDKDFAEEFPDLDFDALVELNVTPNNRRLIRKLMRAHTNGQDEASDATGDERAETRRRALGKPRAMSKKGTSSPRTATEAITLDKIARMTDDEILELRNSSPAFEKRFQVFLEETSGV